MRHCSSLPTKCGMAPGWRRAGLALAALSLILAGPAFAVRWGLEPNICIEEIIDFGVPVIPVGCEVVDCCPGCPGPPFEVDWRIRFDSGVIDYIILDFENLAPEVAAGISIDGPADWISEHELKIGQGETFLRGFTDDSKGRPPVAHTRVPVDQLEGARARLQGKAAASDEPQIGIFVEQWVGEELVNDFGLVYHLILCPPPIGPPGPNIDQIHLNSNDGGDSAIILADGRRPTLLGSRCVQDQLWRGTGIIDVGNYLSQGSCGEEIIAFSDDDEMRLIPGNNWTDPVGDIQPVLFHPMLQPKVTIWLVEGSLGTTGVRAINDMARAHQLYNESNCGITFKSTLNDETTHPSAKDLLDVDCGGAADLRSKIGFTAGSLNVYYVRDAGARGWWCGNDTILVGSGADNETLTHEFGHAFSLQHTNGVAGMPTTNVMAGGFLLRNSITEGQCYRANVNECPNDPSSYLNTSGLRSSLPGRPPLPTRCCPDDFADAKCLDLTLDVLPN